MMPGYWTLRYNGARVAPTPVDLGGPLRATWKYRPKGAGLGFVRAGHEGVFTTVGSGAATRLDLASGAVVWLDNDRNGAALLSLWKGDLLVFGDGDYVRGLDPASGKVRWKRECPTGLGLQNSFIVGDRLVGDLANGFHMIDLGTLDQRWHVPKLAGPLVSDGRVVVWYDRDVVAFDLESGRELWRRVEKDVGLGDLPGCAWNGCFIVLKGDHLTALDLETGRTVWREGLPVTWWHPYCDGRAYAFTLDGVYLIVDLRTGRRLFEKALGPRVPEPARLKKQGLTYGARGQTLETWRSVRLVVSETHAFVQNYSGQIVVLKRDTGEVEQVLEIDAMPTGAEPVIYDGRLLLTDFNATVHCFVGAGVEVPVPAAPAKRPRAAKAVKGTPRVKAGGKPAKHPRR